MHGDLHRLRLLKLYDFDAILAVSRGTETVLGINEVLLPCELEELL